MNKTIKGTFNQNLSLRIVDSVEIISLIDNSVDFLSTIEREEAQHVREWIKEWKVFSTTISHAPA